MAFGSACLDRKYPVVAYIMLEIFISPYKYCDKSKLESQRWNSPVVESCIVDVGWALPTFNR
jgi:hypothetical protein